MPRRQRRQRPCNDSRQSESIQCHSRFWCASVQSHTCVLATSPACAPRGLLWVTSLGPRVGRDGGSWVAPAAAAAPRASGRLAAAAVATGSAADAARQRVGPQRKRRRPGPRSRSLGAGASGQHCRYLLAAGARAICWRRERAERSRFASPPLTPMSSVCHRHAAPLIR